MVADGLLTRQRYREVPPRVDYELTERSKELMPVIGALARWGYEWTWGAPRQGEEINIGAIFRTAPGLLDLPRSVRGTAELVVLAERGQDRSYVFSAGGDAVTLSEQPAEQPDARVVGSIKTWVAALGPGADTSGLEFSGQRALADALLQGFLSAASARADSAAA